MKTQLTFSDIEYSERKRISSRREIFLQKMDALIPWAELIAVIHPYYYTGKRGRPPRGIQKRQEVASDAHLSKVEWRVSERTGKVRYRGLGKNGGLLRMLFGSANILRWRWRSASLIWAINQRFPKPALPPARCPRG